MAEFLINGFLIFLLAIIAVVAIRSIKIFSTVMLAGAYSLICAIIFVSLDAVDVAFTEAAVGAGRSLWGGASPAGRQPLGVRVVPLRAASAQQPCSCTSAESACAKEAPMTRDCMAKKMKRR